MLHDAAHLTHMRELVIPVALMLLLDMWLADIHFVLFKIIVFVAVFVKICGFGFEFLHLNSY